MKVAYGLPAPPLPPYPVLTIGNFDGQHLGHQALIEAVVNAAREQEGTALVLTFSPHPYQFFRPDVEFLFLTSQDRKLAWFEAMGIQMVVMLEFNAALANLTPERFIFDILRDRLGVRTLLVGEHFVFGKNRKGTTEILRTLGPQANFQVKTVSPMLVDGQIVSATRIRKLILDGQVREANAYLGRAYSLGGTVISGKNLGADLGYPTANFHPPRGRVLPADGVYATRARVNGRWFDAATYIGVRPTVDRGARLVEVHILDQVLSLYEQDLEVEFIERVRGDVAFPSVEALTAQIQSDVEAVREILGAHPSQAIRAEKR